MNPELEYKWRSLRRIANSYRVQAYLVIALGGLIILALLLVWGGSPPSPSGVTAFDSGIGVLLACGVVALITSGIATGLFAKAEFIELMIAVEENTRIVALSISKVGLMPSQPAAPTAPPQGSEESPIWPTLLPEQ